MAGRRYWKIAPGENATFWDIVRRRGKACALVGWAEAPDIRKYRSEKEILRALGGKSRRIAHYIWQFANDVKEGDVVIANMGLRQVVGIGVVTSDYLHAKHPRNPVSDLPEDEIWYRHARLVDWRIQKLVDLGQNEFAPPGMYECGPKVLEVVRQAYLKADPSLRNTLDELIPAPPNGERPPDDVSPDSNPMQALLKQFRQIILYGPPGTGKTRTTMRLALEMLQNRGTLNVLGEEADQGDDKAIGSLTQAAQDAGIDPDDYPTWAELADKLDTDAMIAKQLDRYRESRYELVVFHPAYEYEQFVGGIEPTADDNGKMTFKTKAGVFVRLCRAAQEHKQEAVLIIDEINRGKLAKLLGELVYALEYRGHRVTLPFKTADGRDDLVIPENLYIIGTMNSADRSIGHIDVAIRRRFGLCHMGPKRDVVIREWEKAGDGDYGRQLADLMDQLNKALHNDPTLEAEQAVGHSYFLPGKHSSQEDAKEAVQLKWKHQVVPLLREYAQVVNVADGLKVYFDKLLEEALAVS